MRLVELRLAVYRTCSNSLIQPHILLAQFFPIFHESYRGGATITKYLASIQSVARPSTIHGVLSLSKIFYMHNMMFLFFFLHLMVGNYRYLWWKFVNIRISSFCPFGSHLTSKNPGNSAKVGKFLPCEYS